MIQPHGGKLIYRVMTESSREKYIAQKDGMNTVQISQEQVKEVENIANGVFSPLEGFFCQDDYHNVLNKSRLVNDTPWTIPIILDINDSEIIAGDEIGLVNQRNDLVAIMNVEDKFTCDKKELAESGYCTLDQNHPGVAKCYEMNDSLIGGKIQLVSETQTPYDKYKFWPVKTREMFQERGWKTVVGFQTRNTPHNGHEYIQKTALTFVDGLFINPVIGKKKKGDFRDQVILDTYEALIQNYFPENRVFMGILPFEMRYAGPREAIFHAIIRKNFGCTHFIVGRDHAGVGNYYEPFAAQEFFEEFPDLDITPVFFRSFFYCKRCLGVMNEKTCPHGEEDIINFSGTKIRQLLQNGEIPDKLLMRPEVAEIILNSGNPFVE